MTEKCSTGLPLVFKPMPIFIGLRATKKCYQQPLPANKTRYSHVYSRQTGRLSLSLRLVDLRQSNNANHGLAVGTVPLSSSKNLLAKAGLARNFHYPTLNDLYWQPGGNPNLKPEEGITGEAGISYTAIPFGSRVNIEVSAFSSEINHWIMWLPHLKGYWEPVNIEKVKARGLEETLAILSPGRLSGFLGNYGYTRSTVEDAGGYCVQEQRGGTLIPSTRPGFDKHTG